MAEVVSVYPTAGGLYYWSAKLAKGNAPAWSWFTGWFNLIGQVAVIASDRLRPGILQPTRSGFDIAFGVGMDLCIIDS